MFTAGTDDRAVTEALNSLQQQSFYDHIRSLAIQLAHFDWRLYTAKGLSDTEADVKRGLRGSGGYRELRRRLLLDIADSDSSWTEIASEVTTVLGLSQPESSDDETN